MDTTFVAQQMDRNAFYGVNESNPLPSADYHQGVSYDQEVTLAQLSETGGRITRLRVLTGSWGGVKMCDVSYIHATLRDGTTVPVRVTGNLQGIPLWGPRGLKSNLIAWAKEEGVYAKGLGLLDEGNWSILN